MDRVINGRVANESDVHPNGAIFYIPDDRSVPYSFGRELPVSVTIKSNDSESLPPEGTVVHILQAEQAGDGSVLLGFVHEHNDYVCMLEDVEVLPST
ncbi:MAG: hypothetical protein JSS95_02055 [Acidobacteria bacterium]|nr:hypothetical protein [Acidobacteriota bacterium]